MQWVRWRRVRLLGIILRMARLLRGKDSEGMIEEGKIAEGMIAVGK